MRENRLNGDFGEYFVAIHFNRKGYQTDIIDHTGIDLMCYSDIGDGANEEYEQLGISVKFRNIDNGNSDIRIPTDEIHRCYEAAMRRGATPCYAFGIIGKGKLYFRAITLDVFLKNHGYHGIEDVYNIRTKSISENISLKTLERWKEEEYQKESILTEFYHIESV